MQLEDLKTSLGVLDDTNDAREVTRLWKYDNVKECFQNRFLKLKKYF